MTDPTTLHRLTHTTLGNLVRGRLTGRLNLDGRIVRADLSPEAASLVRETVKRTRLRRSERSDIADELIAHFKDAEAAGIPESNSIANFGDPADAAILIRRAKHRQRGVLIRLWTATKWTAAGTAALYALLAVRAFWGEPNIAVDYLAKINAPALAAPAEQTAWPIYREAFIATDFVNMYLDPILDLADSEIDPVAADAFLRQHSELLNAIHRGAGQPALGLAAGYDGDGSPRDRLALSQPEIPAKAMPQSLNARPWVINALLPHLGVLRKASRMVDAEARSAVRANDADRFLRALESLGGLARHAAELPLVPNSLVGAGLLARQNGVIRHALRRRPATWADKDLARIATILEAQTVRPLFNLAGERDRILDAIQRIYTDDGRGGGRMTDEGLAFISNQLTAAVRSGNPADPPVAPNLAAAPVAVLGYADRRDVQATITRLIDLGAADLDVPRWQQSKSQFAQAYDAITGLRRRHLGPVLDLVPDYDAFRNLLSRVQTHRNATRLAVALERHRLAHGQYPADFNQLIPTYLDVLPPDPMTGDPLLVRYENSQPIIYSRGDDRDDDGGRPAQNLGVDPLGDPVDPEQAVSTFIFDNPTDGDWILSDARPPVASP